MVSAISKVSAREILDSRGFPTVECEVVLKDNSIGIAAVPSGASTGSHEAIELRDCDKRYLGKGVRKAVENVNSKISKKIIGEDATEQGKIDEILISLDGTENKSNLGANAILAVSLAVARASANSKKIPLYGHLSSLSNSKPASIPVPFSNIINGGKHAGNHLKIQEFMIAATRAKSFSEACQFTSEIYHTLKQNLKKKFGSSAINVGDEGGFALPSFKESVDALEEISTAIEQLGYQKKAKIALDCAASEFFSEGKYELDGKKFVSSELYEYYSSLIQTYGIISIEDPFSEDDFLSFSEFTKKYGSNLQIIADDLTVTNPKRIANAISLDSANCLLLKVNQIGTLTESFEAAKLCFISKWNVMVSHRSGETEDPFISDLAVALNCKQIKLGAPARGERTAKYNRLLKIEEELGSKSRYGWIK